MNGSQAQFGIVAPRLNVSSAAFHADPQLRGYAYEKFEQSRFILPSVRSHDGNVSNESGAGPSRETRRVPTDQRFALPLRKCDDKSDRRETPKETIGELQSVAKSSCPPARESSIGSVQLNGTKETSVKSTV